MSSVAGLKGALKLYESDKVKGRSSGGELIREIFSNRENLQAFQETASRDGGSGWVALFQCLFQTVIAEKKAVLKSNATAQADRRLADAISLVRWMAERSVHLLSRKPFLALFRHLTAFLVHHSSIFPPAALDYAKALRTLLSYPPHLEALDKLAWKNLLNICWAATLGDPINVESEWNDDSIYLPDGTNDGMDIDEDMEDSGPSNHQGGSRTKIVMTQATNELLSLIPILLASPTAPILPPFPSPNAPKPPPTSLGMTCLMKIHRFLTLFATESTAHLTVLRALNILLVELELNSRNEFVLAGIKLIGPLVGLWGTKYRSVREQLIIAIRILLPFITHKSVPDGKRLGVMQDLEKLLDCLPKESVWRWGIDPLDMTTIRLKRPGKEKVVCLEPFEAGPICAGFDFSHEVALTWTALELYADCAVVLHATSSTITGSTSSTYDGPKAKRRKVDDSITTVISQLHGGTARSRILACQVILFIIARSWIKLDTPFRGTIREALVEALDDENPSLQSWALLALSLIAERDAPQTTSKPKTQSSSGMRQPPSDTWSRIWMYSIRKLVSPTTCRAASQCAFIIMTGQLIDTSIISRDIKTILQQLDVQGPSYPFDSVCSFLTSALQHAKSDVSLYSLNLDAKVVSWLEKWNALDGTRGRLRMDAQTPEDIVSLALAACGIQCPPIVSLPTSAYLPDGQIVSRLINEYKTTPIRRFILDGEVPSLADPELDRKDSPPAHRHTLSSQDSARQRQVEEILIRSAKEVLLDWTSSEAKTTIPPEKARRAIDLSIAVLLFQAALSLTGLHIDPSAIEVATTLLDAVSPVLLSSVYDQHAQLLFWNGLAPLVYRSHTDPPVWPILLKPDVASGIRPDLLPPKAYSAAPDNESGRPQVGTLNLQKALWKLPDVEPCLRNLIALSKQSTGFTDGNTSQYISAPIQVAHSGDDDDFGEIRVAEADMMPLTQAGSHQQHSATMLLEQLVAFRLCGSSLLLGELGPVKDSLLLNSFLSAEGQSFTQIGEVICQAVQRDLLRLTPDALGLIMDALEEMITSYAYSRDGDMLSLTMDLLVASAPLWLAPDLTDTELPHRAINLAKFVTSRCVAENAPPWQVRLRVLIFLDDYLDYEPSYDLWSQIENKDLDAREEVHGPMATVASALLDRDARVRFRATTSTAGLCYLPSFDSSRHMSFYIAAMDMQPRQWEYWDSFLTDILYKLNICVASSSTRHAALYHLYEIPLSNPNFDQHLEPAMHAVAKRLGLKGLAPLFQAFSVVIVSSLLSSEQAVLKLPPRLCGYQDRRGMANAILRDTAQMIVADGYLEQLLLICTETDSKTAETILEHFYSASARLIARHAAGATSDAARKKAQAAIIAEVKSWPIAKSAGKPQELITTGAESISNAIFQLLDINADREETIASLAAIDNHAAELYAYFIPPGIGTSGDPELLCNPCSAGNLIDAMQLLQYLSPEGYSRSAIAFNALLDLFSLLHRQFLVSERLRILRSIALVLSIFAQEVYDPRILQLFLVELTCVLTQPDIFDITLEMLKWAFTLVADGKKILPQLADIMVRLGNARQGIQGDRRILLDDWLLQSIPIWAEHSNMRPSIDIAYVLWSDSTHLFPPDWSAPPYEQIADLVKTANESDAVAVCKQIVSSLQNRHSPRRSDIAVRNFWELKGKMTGPNWSEDGAMAFVNLLSMTEGDIQGPGLDAVDSVPADTRKLAIRLKQEPAIFLRAQILQSILRATENDDHASRVAAYDVLRYCRPFAQELIDRGIIPASEGGDLDLLRPPAPAFTRGPSKSELEALNQDESFLDSADDLNTWVCTTASLLVQELRKGDEMCAFILPLVEDDKRQAVELLPHLVFACLTCQPTKSSKESQVLEERRVSISKYFSSLVRRNSTSLQVIECVISIILYLHYFNPPSEQNVLALTYWLDVDLLLFSEAALKIGSFATSLMFLEMAMRDTEEYSTLDVFDSRVQNIMFSVYSNVEDPDGFYGIKTHDVKDALHRRIDHEGFHLRSLGLHGAMLQADTQADTRTVVSTIRNLHEIGLDQLASLVMRPIMGSTVISTSSEPIFFDLAWRTGDWELPVPVSTPQVPSATFYAAMKAIHRERDHNAAKEAVFRSIHSEMVRLKDLGMERMTEIKALSANLLCLREVALWLSEPAQTAIREADFRSPAIVRYGDLEPTMSFSLAEKITATRLSILDAVQLKEKQNVIGDITTPQADGFKILQKSVHLALSTKARIEGNVQAAINTVTALQYLEQGEPPSNEVQDEFSQVLWLQQEHGLAIQFIQEIIKPLEKDQIRNSGRLAVLLARQAHWNSLAKQMAPYETKQIFERATTLASGKVSGGPRIHRNEVADIFHQYAKFADQHQVSLHAAPDLHRLREWRSRKRNDLSSIEESLKKKRDQSVKSLRDERLQELEEDERAIHELEQEHQTFVRYAIRMYTTAITYSDEYDDSVTRLVSLWFQFGAPKDLSDRQGVKDCDDLHRHITGPLDRAPTHKFLFLGPQLAARLYRPTGIDSKFHSTLQSLLLKLSQQHPYHILYSIIPLAHGVNLATSTSSNRRSSDVQQQSQSPEGRGPAAAEILQVLASEKGKDTPRTAVKQMTQFHDAAMQWCNSKSAKAESSSRVNKKHAIPNNYAISTISKLAIPVVTKPPPIDLTMQYRQITTLRGYRNEYSLLGGLHRPKKMQAIDSLGNVHPELGDDEIRQDAVMEQVFEMTNKILSRDRKTNERKLKYRTYLVVPLAGRTGVLEFVAGGMSIGDWLRPAHERYRKGIDVPSETIRTAIKELQDKDHNDPKLVERFNHYQANFKPVMRHFFTEKHKNPTAWFAMRLNYSRSVAVTSIVGHILGIGDRHLSNIMIDQVTGEVIHIDFGIVFEDGERLRIPERVPFRLTNDMVDGLGITGVDGTFRRCSEQTLRVLRDSADLIMTVLEVFKHDPLYSWTGDPDKLQRVQGGTRSDLLQTASVQEKADRTLARIRQKLRGNLSIEYAVNQLIQQARAPENLAKIFQGWHPWV